MPLPEFPYIVYGTIIKEGVPQSGVTVTIQSEYGSDTRVTDADGHYIYDDLAALPYAPGGVIAVSVPGASNSFIAASEPEEKEINLFFISISSGSITVSGTAVSLLAARTLPIASGNLSLTGTNVGLLTTRKLSISSGSLGLAGTDIGLLATRKLPVTSGALSLAGTPVGLLAARKIPVASGSLTLSGTAVQTLKGSKIAVASGSLTLAGTDVNLLALRKLIAASGSLILTGTAVGLEYSGSAVFPLIITISKQS